MSAHTSGYDPSYTPTEDDIQAYNEDQAKADLETEQAEQIQVQAPAHRHEWTEDGATFAVEGHSNGIPELFGERFHHDWAMQGDEAVLAREVLRLAEQNSLLLRNLSDMAENRSAEHGLSRQLSSDLEQVEDENAQLTDRLNALTARIEEALDLLIHETEGSGRVEQAYRKLEGVLLEKTKTD